MLIVLEIRY